MKKLILIVIFISLMISVRGQISLTSDSVIYCKSEVTNDNFIKVSQRTENFSLEIDKDLMTLRIFGTGHEHAVIEVAYIVDLLEVDPDQNKWLFQGVDKNCISYTITLDVISRRIDFLTFKKDSNDNKILTLTYYPIRDVIINKDAINRHLQEKFSSGNK